MMADNTGVIPETIALQDLSYLFLFFFFLFVFFLLFFPFFFLFFSF